MLSAAPVNARSQMRRDSRPLGRRRVCGLGGGDYSTGAIGSVALDGAMEPGTAHGTAGEEGQTCVADQVEHLASGGCQVRLRCVTAGDQRSVPAAWRRRRRRVQRTCMRKAARLTSGSRWGKLLTGQLLFNVATRAPQPGRIVNAEGSRGPCRSAHLPTGISTGNPSTSPWYAARCARVRPVRVAGAAAAA